MNLALLQQAAETSGLEKSFRLLDLPPAWITVLVVLPAFFLVTWLGYSKERISTTSRTVLSSLRLLAFVLLFLVLARPVLVEQREEIHPAEVLVLVDDSASMQRIDAYSGAPETAERIAAATGLAPREATRLELAKAALTRALSPKLEQGGYDVKLYGFAETSSLLGDLDDATGRGASTHLGDALLQTLAAHRGRPVTDVVVLSDGRSNGGQPALEGARALAAAGIPVHTVVVGDTRPERNGILELIEAPGDALQGDELAVTVRVTGRGELEGQEGQIVLEELDGDESEPRIQAEETVTLTGNGERVVLFAPAGPRTGERRFRASLTPLSGETLLDDNRVEFSVHVSPALVRVLYVEGYPRWEYRYLKNLLLRADKLIQVQCFLVSATSDFPQEASKGLEPLQQVPATRDELLDNYDVVILGDVHPFAISPDPSRCEAFLEALREFVEAGGGVLFQAGEFNNPTWFSNTPLEELLPVVHDGVLAFEGSTEREFRPLLVNPTAPHEILRLHPDVEINRRLWEDPDGLRGFYWYAPVKRAKPGTEVLLTHPTDRNPQTGELYPLLVLGHYPEGRTMFLAVDSTWMWRYHFGDRYHEVFWRNAIRWLALGRLKGGDRRFRLESSRSSYDLEQRIVLEARVLNEDFRPSDRPTQAVRWSGPDERVSELELSAQADRPGIYRGHLQVDAPGLYRAWIEVGGQRVSATEFEVHLPSRENADPSPDPGTLAAIATRTGGRSLDLASVALLADEFPGGEERREPISSSLEDAWDDWATLLLALGVLSAEWILRKRVELL